MTSRSSPTTLRALASMLSAVIAGGCSADERACLDEVVPHCEENVLVECRAHGRYAFADLQRRDCAAEGMICAAGGKERGASCITTVACKPSDPARCEPSGTTLMCVSDPRDETRSFLTRVPAVTACVP